MNIQETLSEIKKAEARGDAEEARRLQVALVEARKKRTAMTRAELDAIRERANAATPGPWWAALRDNHEACPALIGFDIMKSVEILASSDRNAMFPEYVTSD